MDKLANFCHEILSLIAMASGVPAGRFFANGAAAKPARPPDGREQAGTAAATCASRLIVRSARRGKLLESS